MNSPFLHCPFTGSHQQKKIFSHAGTSYITIYPSGELLINFFSVYHLLGLRLLIRGVLEGKETSERTRGGMISCGQECQNQLGTEERSPVDLK